MNQNHSNENHQNEISKKKGDVLMSIDQQTLIQLTAIVAPTLVILTALVIVAGGRFILNVGNFGSLTVEGQRSIPEKTKVDCLPGGENSQLLNCNNQ
jgi:hypothetical protein